MSNIIDQINPQQLGEKLQRARSRSGLTQEEAATIIGVSRTTITAIEAGQRKIKAPELAKLADAYGYQVSDLLNLDPTAQPFKAQFRGPTAKTPEQQIEIDKFVVVLEDLSRDYFQLEEILNRPLVYNYPAEYNIKGIDPERAASDIAMRERQRLGLGDGPLPDLRDLLERQVGIRVFYLPLQPSSFSAIYAYDEKMGACVAINNLHTRERRRWSLAHEYAHFLVHRRRAAVSVETKVQRKPAEERFADNFTDSFLMPESSITRSFNDMNRTGNISLGDILTLAHSYGVSYEAMFLRLEDLRLIPAGFWDKIRSEKSFNISNAKNDLGIKDISGNDDTFPVRYKYLAFDALMKGEITGTAFANFLNVDITDARSIAEDLRGTIIDSSHHSSDRKH